MLGWKLVHLPAGDGYFSLFTASHWWIKHFAIGHETRVDEAPLFFYGDDLTAADLLKWGLHKETWFEMALLRVEAVEPVRAMRYVANTDADYPAFWQAVLAGQPWPPERSYTCPPKTLCSPALTPLAVAWVGRRKVPRGSPGDAELEVELAAAMAKARELEEPIVTSPDFSIYLPVIGSKSS